MDDHLELLLNGQLYKKLNEVVYKPVTNDYGLSMFDIKLLLFLKEHDRYDTARDIVEIHYLTKSYVSKAIDALIIKGYLKRKPVCHLWNIVRNLLQVEKLPHKYKKCHHFLEKLSDKMILQSFLCRKQGFMKED